MKTDELVKKSSPFRTGWGCLLTIRVYTIGRKGTR